MRTLALRRCARVLRSKPRHAHVLRLRGRVGQRRTGSTDRDGSDPPVRGPGTGSGLGVFSHTRPRPPGVAPGPRIPGGKAIERRCESGGSTERSGVRVSTVAGQVGCPVVHGPVSVLEQVGCTGGPPLRLPSRESTTRSRPARPRSGRRIRRFTIKHRCLLFGHLRSGGVRFTTSAVMIEPCYGPWRHLCHGRDANAQLMRAQIALSTS